MPRLAPLETTPLLVETKTPTPQVSRPEGIRVELVAEPAKLIDHVAAWDELARHTLEPNPFLESWLLLPAIEAFGRDKDISYLFLYRHDDTLCGFLPVERQLRYKGLPISLLRLWEHDHCFVGTPLLHKDHAREALRALLDWLGTDARGASIFEFPMLPGEGPVFQLMVDEIRTRSLLTFQDSCFTRAWLQLRESGEAYLKETLSGNRRRDLTRKEKKLREMGNVEYRALTDAAELGEWLDQFLRLEGCGWKGKEGTALNCWPANEAFFRAAATAAFARGQLHMIGLFLDGKPIAIKSDFVSGPGAFFFKPGYDENFSKHSPGLLLEVENIRHLHAQSSVKWMDSCTSPDNGMLNDLWLDRRILQNFAFATGQGAGRFVTSLLPLFRWAKRAFRR